MIETNAKEVYDKFLEFSTKEMKKSLSKAVKECGGQLRKETRTQLRKELKNTNKINPKYTDTLQQGVRVGKVKEDKDGNIYCYVMITSTRRQGSGSFRLHILENGSSGERFAHKFNGRPLRKPRRTGRLKAYQFFQSANVTFESTYNDRMNAAFNKAVEKINNKKFGYDKHS